MSDSIPNEVWDLEGILKCPVCSLSCNRASHGSISKCKLTVVHIFVSQHLNRVVVIEFICGRITGEPQIR